MSVDQTNTSSCEQHVSCDVKIVPQARYRDFVRNYWIFEEVENNSDSNLKKLDDFNFHICFAKTKPIQNDLHRFEIQQSFDQIVKNRQIALNFEIGNVIPFLLLANKKLIPKHLKFDEFEHFNGVKQVYLSGRSPCNSPIVLAPKNNVEFEQINQFLFNKLNELNKKWKTTYEFEHESHPIYFFPHVILIHAQNVKEFLNPNPITQQSEFIKNRDALISDLQRNVPSIYGRIVLQR